MERAWCVGSIAYNAGKFREKGADRRRHCGQGGDEAGILTAGWFAEW
jgi:hypothetical protein